MKVGTLGYTFIKAVSDDHELTGVGDMVKL